MQRSAEEASMPAGGADGGVFVPEQRFLRCEKCVGDQAKQPFTAFAIGRFRYERASSRGTDGHRRECDGRSARGLS